MRRLSSWWGKWLKSRQAAEDWNFYLCRVDDQAASIFVDLGPARDAPFKSFGQLAYLDLIMRAPRPDGLSSQEEFDTLSNIDDSLSEVLEGVTGRYVGRLTTDGRRTFYFYCAKPETFRKASDVAMRRFPEYAFEVGHRPDPEWSIYRDFLYPSPADLHRMRNREVLDALLDHGDKPQLPRLIDHWAYFDSEQAAQSYGEWLGEQGFDVSAIEPTDQGEHTVRLARVDQPQDIDAVAAPLIAYAEQLDGNYDGWECQVIRGDTNGDN